VVSELEWLAASTVLFFATFPPSLRWAAADHLTPAWLRAWWTRLPVTLAALLLILGGTL
jgi:hypothetical protein